MRWMIDVLRAQEDKERRKRRNWNTLDRLLCAALDQPFTPYSTGRAAIGVLIADTADRGWKWTGTALDYMPFGPVSFYNGGERAFVEGDTIAHATAAAAARPLGNPRRRIDYD
jgi:hypothetical protein